MVANYSPCSQTCKAYNAKKVFKKYDLMYSSSMKPLRGYVRYGGNKISSKNLLEEMKNYISSATSTLLELILVFFVKGLCMKKEKEYRFIMFTKNKNIDNIVFETQFNPTIQFGYEKSQLKRNCFYDDNGNICNEVLETEEADDNS